MKNVLCRFKKITGAFCFFVLNNLSAMDTIDEQANADIEFYNELVKFNAKVESLTGQGIPTEYDSASLVDELDIVRYWSFVPEGVIVISKNTITNYMNVIFRGKIKVSGININKSVNELLGTNAYPGVYLAIGADFTHYQILAAMEVFHKVDSYKPK